jgi:hypothetical protein
LLLTLSVVVDVYDALLVISAVVDHATSSLHHPHY